MGGLGSGKGWQGGKRTTDDYRSLDVRQFQRDGLLTPARSFGWSWTRNGEKVASISIETASDYLTLVYRVRQHDDEWKDLNYPVRLEWTDCNLGGKRAWFHCPCHGCGRRVALLYLGNASIFACRHCYRLAYASQREKTHDRLARKADRIRKRLGWNAGILNYAGFRPKGMHWRTYWRLKMQHDTLALASMEGMMAQLGIANQRIARQLEKLNLAPELVREIRRG